VSTTPEPQVDLNLLEHARRRINLLVEEIAKLSETDSSPAEYYGEFLNRVLSALGAPAGIVWIRTPQGHLQQQYQANMHQVGVDRTEADRQMHDELLRSAALMARPQMLPPHSGIGAPEEGKVVPGNPTDYVILLAPILVDKQVAGLVEVFHSPDRNLGAQHGFLQFLTRMADLASAYTRNHQLRTMIGQQALWTQLESFARQVHGSLNPTEVSYQVANEGRRLIECDRLSVAQRLGKKAKIEAVSGTDVVEKRSNLVRLMAKLVTRVMLWGERLVYSGTKDESLPPDVLDALDNYLAESNSKLLVVLPLKDEREEESTKPVRSALLMECFDPPASAEQLVARLEVVGRHCASALYNAAEHKRIPMRFLWSPLAKVQEGLGGKTRAIIVAVTAAVVAIVLAMIFVPYPLKMDAKGQLLPVQRGYIFTPVEGHIEKFLVEPNQIVNLGDPVVRMHDLELEKKMRTLDGEIKAAQSKSLALANESQKPGTRDNDRASYNVQKASEDNTIKLKLEELATIRDQTHAIPGLAGYFYLVAPLSGTVLSSTFREDLEHNFVKQNQPILRLGNKTGHWEVELKIPEKHIGQVLAAFADDPSKELDVDLILHSDPTKTYHGKLARNKVGGEATPNRDENNETDPVVTAYVRLDGDDIAPAYLLPHKENLLVAGTEVAAKIRCGNHRMGYSLFYGVWEFFYEKVVFFF